MAEENNNKHQLISTVAKNSGNFSTHQHERSKIAQNIYHNIGATTIDNIKLIINWSMTKECPMTIEDINIAADIWRKDISCFKGKSTWNRLTPVRVGLVDIHVELKR